MLQLYRFYSANMKKEMYIALPNYMNSTEVKVKCPKIKGNPGY